MFIILEKMVDFQNFIKIVKSLGYDGSIFVDFFNYFSG